MELLEAFREFGPCLGDPCVDERRNEAARLIHKELVFLISRLRSYDDEREDIIAKALLNLCKMGPRGERAGDPVDDTGVKRFLVRILVNLLIDKIRTTHEIPTDTDELLGTIRHTFLDMFLEIDIKTLEIDMKKTREFLQEKIFPELARAFTKTDHSEGFLESLRILHAIETGQITQDEAMKITKTSLSTFRQRKHRTKKKVLEWANGLETSDQFPRERIRIIHMTLAESWDIKDRSWGIGDLNRKIKESKVGMGDE
ncbi:MAG: hypothetical protein JW902_17200 [Syntrophaceae bacterium]|nr:hypothetical protein [Syntrophaceae bacterium]